MGENDQITERLTPKQERLIEALLAGHNITVAARASGVADTTARRWLKLAGFQAAYKSAQKQLFNQALQGLMLLTKTAIKTLSEAMSDEDAPYSVKVRSAQIVIENAVQIYKAGELEAKIDELEQLLLNASGAGQEFSMNGAYEHLLERETSNGA